MIDQFQSKLAAPEGRHQIIAAARVKRGRNQLPGDGQSFCHAGLFFQAGHAPADLLGNADAGDLVMQVLGIPAADQRHDPDQDRDTDVSGLCTHFEKQGWIVNRLSLGKHRAVIDLFPKTARLYGHVARVGIESRADGKTGTPADRAADGVDTTVHIGQQFDQGEGMQVKNRLCTGMVSHAGWIAGYRQD